MNRVRWKIMEQLHRGQKTVRELWEQTGMDRLVNHDEYTEMLEGIIHLVSVSYILVLSEIDHEDYGVSAMLKLTEYGKERMQI
ncbi:MAG: hypothetical protein GY832_30880 [Chloroflexi bacterium]|nr:hypothetical protein [Chloroflexota bacterium]